MKLVTCRRGGWPLQERWATFRHQGEIARPDAKVAHLRGCMPGQPRGPLWSLVTHRAIKALAVAILPRGAACNVERPHADLRQPLLDGIGDELRAVV